MRFRKAALRQYGVKNPRNAKAFLRFSPCLDTKPPFLNCKAPEIQKFSYNRVFLRRSHTFVWQDEKRTRMRKILHFGRIGFDSRYPKLADERAGADLPAARRALVPVVAVRVFAEQVVVGTDIAFEVRVIRAGRVNHNAFIIKKGHYPLPLQRLGNVLSAIERECDPLKDIDDYLINSDLKGASSIDIYRRKPMICNEHFAYRTKPLIKTISIMLQQLIYKIIKASLPIFIVYWVKSGIKQIVI